MGNVMGTSGVGRDSRDGNFPGIPGFLGHFPEFPGKRGRESRDFPGNPGKMVIFGIPVSRELKNPGKLTPLFANNAQNIKPCTFHASGLCFKAEFLLDTQPFIFLENNLTTDGASV